MSSVYDCFIRERCVCRGVIHEDRGNDLGGVKVNVSTECFDDSLPQYLHLCTKQRFEFTDTVTGKREYKSAAGKLVDDVRRKRSKNRASFDALAQRLQCVRDIAAYLIVGTTPAGIVSSASGRRFRSDGEKTCFKSKKE